MAKRRVLFPDPTPNPAMFSFIKTEKICTLRPSGNEFSIAKRWAVNGVKVFLPGYSYDLNNKTFRPTFSNYVFSTRPYKGQRIITWKNNGPGYSQIFDMHQSGDSTLCSFLFIPWWGGDGTYFVTSDTAGWRIYSTLYMANYSTALTASLASGEANFYEFSGSVYKLTTPTAITQANNAYGNVWMRYWALMVDQELGLVVRFDHPKLKSRGLYPTDGEITNLIQNPWQIFSYQSKKLFFISSGVTSSQYSMPANTGTYTLEGNTATLAFNRVLISASGTYTLTGNAANLSFNRALTAEAGTYTLSGKDAGLAFNRVLSAGQGSYTLTGNDATLTYTPVGGPTYTLPASVGTYTLTGNTAGLAFNRALIASLGTYSLTGQNVGLGFNRVLTAAKGTYTLTGQDATLAFNRVMAMGQGTYTLTGNDVTFLWSGAGSSGYTISMYRGVSKPNTEQEGVTKPIHIVTDLGGGLYDVQTLPSVAGDLISKPIYDGVEITGYVSAPTGPTYTLTANVGSYTLTGIAMCMAWDVWDPEYGRFTTVWSPGCGGPHN